MPQPNNGNGYRGFQQPETAGSEFNAMSFLARMLIGQIATATLAQVVAVTNAGELAAEGFVDVHPLVRQVDGVGNAVPHGTVFRLPYSRVHGGTNAIILDPQIGDIGVVLFADHDISTVKATKAEGNPGSWRRFDMADGIYLFSVLGAGALPVQYVRFHPDGIEVVTPGNLLVTVAGTTTINSTGDVAVNTPANASIIAGGMCNITGDAGIRIFTEGDAEVTIDGSINATVNGSIAATVTGTADLTAAAINLNP